MLVYRPLVLSHTHLQWWQAHSQQSNRNYLQMSFLHGARPAINLDMSLSCESVPTQMATFLWPISITTSCANAKRYGWRRWEGVELGTSFERGLRRESAHHLNPRGRWRSKTLSSTPLQLQCASVVELCRGNWRRVSQLPGSFIS